VTNWLLHSCFIEWLNVEHSMRWRKIHKSANIFSVQSFKTQVESQREISRRNLWQSKFKLSVTNTYKCSKYHWNWYCKLFQETLVSFEESIQFKEERYIWILFADVLINVIYFQNLETNEPLLVTLMNNHFKRHILSNLLHINFFCK